LHWSAGDASREILPPPEEQLRQEDAPRNQASNSDCVATDIGLLKSEKMAGVLS
jgi:hypothetical protein